MAATAQLKKATQFVQIIQKEGSIHKYDLMDKMSMGIPSYDQLKPYIEYRYGHYVEYIPKTKHWMAKEVIETEASKALLEE